MLAAVIQGLGRFQEPVPYREADDAALEWIGLLGKTDEASESRLRARLGFTRSALKRIGAIDNRERGSWALTEIGRPYLDLHPETAQSELLALVGASYANRSAGAFLREASERAPVHTTVRNLLAQWGVSRRGASVNQQIHDDLEGVGLRTEPNFVISWIDAEIVLVPIDEPPRDQPLEPEVVRQFWEDDISLNVGSLRSANLAVQGVTMDDTLIRAESLMMRYDYSQLAVLSGPRTLRGAISWQSIAQARLRDLNASRVANCIEQAHTVRATDHLLNVVPEVVQRGFVFVEGRDGILAGIVTMADLSEQFVSFANPFMLVGEIERWLRRALDSVFSLEELAAASDSSDPDRNVESAGNLTLGEMIRMLEPPANWDRLVWPAERATFLDAMHEVRRIRNEIMHFSPDPLSDADLNSLKNTLTWIRHLLAAP